MTKTFGATSTTDEVLAGVNLRGKRILVTGVSAGIGVETARTLAAHGAQVVGAARNLDNARAATEPVRAQAANGGGLELVELDLASLSSVRVCADALVSAGRRGVRAYALDPDRAKALWAKSEAMVGERF
jgi:NAD(P)-dependent dehydrogenase (short-subunit alcohol dehydrogenase family)